MRTVTSKFGILTILSAATLAVSSGRATASPYYAATYVGAAKDSRWDGSTVVDEASSASYAFAAPTTQGYAASLTPDQLAGLPSVTVNQGAAGGPQVPQTYQMTAFAANAAGTVLGQLPAGGQGSNPWATAGWVYSVRQADGTYSGVQTLVGYGEYYAGPKLSDSNEILLDTKNNGFLLVDPSMGVSRSVKDLIPPDLLAKYGGMFHVDEISARGELLVQFGNPFGGDSYILAAPPVPEPSTFWVAVAAAAGLGLRARRRRARAGR